MRPCPVNIWVKWKSTSLFVLYFVQKESTDRSNVHSDSTYFLTIQPSLSLKCTDIISAVVVRVHMRFYAAHQTRQVLRLRCCLGPPEFTMSRDSIAVTFMSSAKPMIFARLGICNHTMPSFITVQSNGPSRGPCVTPLETLYSLTPFFALYSNTLSSK